MIEQNRINLLEKEIGRMRVQSDWMKEGQPEFFSTGIQIVDIDHIASEIESAPGGIAHFFTPTEINYCQGRMASFAGRLAGKLAVMEILGAVVPWQDITIESALSKLPLVRLDGLAKKLAGERRIALFPISISHDKDLAVAFVMSVGYFSPKLSLGTDISSVSRIAKFLLKHGDHFQRRNFSIKEVSEAGNNPVMLAEKWAGKEAVAKALGTGIWVEGVALKDIQILTGNDGLPYINLTGQVLVQANERSLKKWRIGIISDRETPLAFVYGTS